MAAWHSGNVCRAASNARHKASSPRPPPSSALISLVLNLYGAPGKALRKLESLEWAELLLKMVGLFARDLTFYLQEQGELPIAEEEMSIQ